MLEMHPREELPELKLNSDVEESAEKILDEYLHGDGNITEITDKVYAMGKAIAIKTVTVQKETNSCRKNKLSNGRFRQSWRLRWRVDPKSQKWDLLKNSNK